MENNNNNINLQFETLNPSAFAFPSHRRRPLKSQTYDTFIRILSLCRDASFSSHHPQDDNGGAQVGQVHDSCFNKSEIAVVDQVLVDNGSKLDGYFSDMQVKARDFDSRNVLREGNEEFARDDNNDNNLHSVVSENEARDQVVEIVNDQNDGHCMVDFRESEGNSPIRELKRDEEIRVHEFCESIESSLLMDTVAELSRRGEDCEKKGDVEESNVNEGMEQELQRREMELEKLISDSVGMDSSLCVAVDEDIEEGEISGEDGAYDRSMDVLFEDDMAPKEKKVEKVQLCEDISDKEKVAHEIGENEVEKCNISTSLFQCTTSKSYIMIEKEKESPKEDQAYKSDDVACWKDIETQKADSHDGFLLETGGVKPVGLASMLDHAEPSLEHPAPTGKVTPQSVAKSQSSETVGEDASASKKKSKRGPLTKEKKAKKKIKERIKRAEKNRKLGVKRLKLQPVVKPKTVTYCRHYLMGRCHEGEKCKFSHDTIPLTKSKPCCHFARHSCMKGDDCPFDHQLSKYPCNNYVTSGFCSRGASCLFSHKMPATEGSLTTSTILEPGLKSLPMLSDSKKLENIHGTARQNVDAKSCSTGLSVGKSTEHSVAVPVQKHPAQAPRGVNIFFHGKSSPSENGKQKQAGQPSVPDDNTNLGCEKVQSGADNGEKVNKVIEMAATRTPKGINFLSFGKAPLNDSSSIAVSSLFPNRDSGIGKSMLRDMIRGKEIASSPTRDNSTKVANMCVKIGSVLPSASPHGINFVSLGKVSSDHSSATQQTSSHPNKGNSSLTFAHERNGAPLKFQHDSGMPYTSVSSLLDKSAAENSIGMASSSKTSFLSNTPSSVQKALQSTLSFAAKFESDIKFDPSIRSSSLATNFNKKTENSQNKSVKGLTVLDFLYGDSCKTKT